MDELIEKITAFRDKRNWGQFHNPKDLASLISGLKGAALSDWFNSLKSKGLVPMSTIVISLSLVACRREWLPD
ncbi:hypothetical protein [Paenibacillus sp. FSL K6-0108]|uniref:hypothetical protein n=1 Tax=Paenibacillus sp. FSL K6-0108 TaxID=2921417 RepID=UPI003247345F